MKIKKKKKKFYHVKFIFLFKKKNKEQKILKCLTMKLVETYTKCNPKFKFDDSLTPKRSLTNPDQPMSNNGFDNENNELIIFANDLIGTTENQ